MNLIDMLKEIRARGWRVGCHNDYTSNGTRFTFWLFTHPGSGKFANGEGETDELAVERAMAMMAHRP